MKIEKPSKKSLYYLAIVLAIALLVFAGLLYYLSLPPKIEIPEERPAEKSMEEILKSLTAPDGAAEPISKEVQKSISASSEKEGQGEVSEDIIKSLSAPE